MCYMFTVTDEIILVSHAHTHTHTLNLPPPSLSLSLSLSSVPRMGTCLSNEKLPDNVFIVRNIHDDHRRFPKGIIEVTHVELIYKDARSGDEWVWPLKYLRKYGCDREIFSFEAGRKCPGGEGLYAFSTKKASQLFDMVARNISEGGLEGGGTLSPPEVNHVPHSPINLAAPPIPSPNPPPPPASNPPSHPPSAARLPEYQNMSYQDGHLNGMGAQLSSSSPPPVPPPNEHRLSNASITPSPPPRVNYTEVNLPESSEATLATEVGKDQEKRVSYSQIDIKQTEEYNEQLARKQAENAHPLPDLGNAEFKIVTPCERGRSKNSPRPPSGSSAGSGASSSAHRSMSEGNFGTPAGENSRDKPHSKGNGSIPGRSHSHSTSSAPDQNLYQNMVVPAPAPPIPEVAESPQPQANYMNITPQVPDQPQQTYENLKPGHGITSPPAPQFSSPVATSPPRVVGGGPLYADLVLPKMSTPKRDTPDDDHHAVLSFSSRANNTPAPRERSKTAKASPPPADILLERDRSATAVAAAGPPPAAEEPVNYARMDFNVMAALRKTKKERDEEIRQRTEEEAREEQRRKKEEEEKLAKKKKKQKKRNRRNSHQ